MVSRPGATTQATAPAAPVSAWAPLRHRLYRGLWTAQLVSNVGTWMQNVGAVWLMGTLGGSAALVALVQCLVRLEVTEGFASASYLRAVEVLDENRFLAARDGAGAALVDPDLERRVPVTEIIDELLPACRSHAEALGCADELALVPRLLAEPGHEHQRALAGAADDQRRLIEALAEEFAPASVAA